MMLLLMLLLLLLMLVMLMVLLGGRLATTLSAFALGCLAYGDTGLTR